MKLQTGNIYWINLKGSVAHPHVVIAHEATTVTVCALTTNQNKQDMPGNILLSEGEGGLKDRSIVDVSKIFVIAKFELGEYIGQLANHRLSEIQAGIEFLDRSFLS